jgi:hypothetical protein
MEAFFVELSYSLAIVLEVLVLIPIFYFLLSRNKTNQIALGKKALTLTAIALFAGATILFLIPKINLIYDYDHTKLTADAWYHYAVTRIWSDSGVIPTDVYPYYSRFPVTYGPQIVLHEMTGISLFDSMTIYYLIVGIAGLPIVAGIAKEILRGTQSEKIIFAGISVVVYSFLQYLNLLFVQQYPLATGTVVALFCIYSFVLLTKKRKRSILYLSIAGIILALSHPFAPIFVSILFLVYFGASKLVTFRPDPYIRLVSGRVAVFIALALIVSGLTYSVFVATGIFESGVKWSQLNVKYTVQKLETRLFESTVSGVGQSFEGRYQTVDTLVYSLNWALPTATSLSTLIFLLSRKLKIEEGETMHLLFPLAIVSTFLFILTFAFSFVEFAFSRYFGAFALAFNIPLTSYLVFRMVKIRLPLLRYSALSIMGLAVFASVTDPTMLPEITFGDTVLRDSQIYATELDIAAWDGFYLLAAEQNKLIQTNVNAAPIRHYKVINDYQNEIVMNPMTYTPGNNNTYAIIDKDRFNTASESQDNPGVDRVYDNSKIYFLQ